MSNPEIKKGILEITDKGFGFLRNPELNFQADPDDIYISVRQVNECYLREGCLVEGEVGEVKHQGQNRPLSRVISVNGMSPDEWKDVREIRDRIAMDPLEQYKIELGQNDDIGRTIDIISPIGKGQRGLIVAPPKAGKTTVLKHIAKAILTNHPEAEVYGVLIDERPEEVTDFQRSSGCRVFSSSLDERPEKHMRIAKLAFATAISRAETGKDVVVLIDSLTRMSRAFNLRSNNRGRMLSGGLGSEALALPKRFFGAARNFPGKGSLSVLATILIETNSRMDEVIFQEFKGTGNMEIVLDRHLAERMIYPAVNIRFSGTRKEEKILAKPEKIATIRRKLSNFRDVDAMEELLGVFRKTESNAELLSRLTG